MITLQRKLAVIVKDHVFTDGKAPRGIAPKQAYPVIGYSVQNRKKKPKENEPEKEYEEIAVFIVVNQKNELAYIYPSYCEVYVDIFTEEICSSAFVKGDNGLNEKKE